MSARDGSPTPILLQDMSTSGRTHPRIKELFMSNVQQNSRICAYLHEGYILRPVSQLQIVDPDEAVGHLANMLSIRKVGLTMESSNNLGDMTAFWEAELDEDGARKDRMPPPLPVSTENMRLISLSRKSILVGLVKEIPARDPVFDTWYRYRGFFSHVRVYVPDSADATKFREAFCSSFQEFSTAEVAEEKAAENMIRTLEATCKFEVKDLNWEMRRRLHVDSFNSCTGWRAAKDEICALKMKMEEMRKGWRSTLEGVDRWCDHIRSCGAGYAEDAFPFVLQEGITKFESVCEEKYINVYSSSL